MIIDISMAVLLFISSLSNGLQALHHRSSGKARAVRVLAVHHGGGDLGAVDLGATASNFDMVETSYGVCIWRIYIYDVYDIYIWYILWNMDGYGDGDWYGDGDMDEDIDMEMDI